MQGGSGGELLTFIQRRGKESTSHTKDNEQPIISFFAVFFEFTGSVRGARYQSLGNVKLRLKINRPQWGRHLPTKVNQECPFLHEPIVGWPRERVRAAIAVWGSPWFQEPNKRGAMVRWRLPHDKLLCKQAGPDGAEGGRPRWETCSPEGTDAVNQSSQ